MPAARAPGARVRPVRVVPRHARAVAAAASRVRRGAACRARAPFPCGQAFVPIACLPDLRDGVAVAARRHLVAVSDRGAGEVRIFGASGAELLAVIPVAEPGAARVLAAGRAARGGRRRDAALLRFSLAGDALGEWPRAAPGDGRGRRSHGVRAGLRALAGDARRRTARSSLWRAAREDAGVRRARPARAGRQLRADDARARRADDGFCLRDAPAGADVLLRLVRPPSRRRVRRRPPIARVTQGQLLTLADRQRPAALPLAPRAAGGRRAAGHRRCPSPSRRRSSRRPSRRATRSARRAGRRSPPAFRIPTDWDQAPRGSLDYLVRQPPGRYLHLRLRLSGDGAATPVVHRVRIDLPALHEPRAPAARLSRGPARRGLHRALPVALRRVDRRARPRHRALPGAARRRAACPDAVLPWLGTFLDLAFEAVVDARERRRALLAATPELYRRRGTRRGLAAAIRAGAGRRAGDPGAGRGARRGAPSSHSARARRRAPLRTRARPLHAGRVRAVRGAAARLRRSRRSTRSPAARPGACACWSRRRARRRAALRERLTRLLDSQKPAHTVVTTRVGGTGFVVGLLVGGRRRHAAGSAAGAGAGRTAGQRPPLARDRALDAPRRRARAALARPERRRRNPHGDGMSTTLEKERTMRHAKASCAEVPQFDRLTLLLRPDAPRARPAGRAGATSARS